MQLELSEAYTACLVPVDAACLEGVALSEENYSFLTKVGLPLKGEQEINPNLPITFFPQPIVKRYPYLQHVAARLSPPGISGRSGGAGR